MVKFVTSFDEGKGLSRDVLGGKGHGLAEMTSLGLPVPSGFTVSTAACGEYLRQGRFPNGLEAELKRALKDMERRTGKKFGDPDDPLLVSVRSGAPVSMPGMMDTILNLGLNEATVKALGKQTGDEGFAHDCYRRLLTMFGDVVLGVGRKAFDEALESVKKKEGVDKDRRLSAAGWKEVVAGQQRVLKEHGKEVPQDPWTQLHHAVEAVFRSWNNPRAAAYREIKGIPDNLGTAVNVQAMVFGNLDEKSATGVLFTRDPSTGEQRLYGEFLIRAQGEDVVAGIRTPRPLAELQKEMPDVYEKLDGYAHKLENHYREMQDIEFTVEKGTLHIMQTRRGERTGAASIRIAVDMVREGLITQEEAVRRVKPSDVERALHRQVDPRARPKVLVKGLNASPGAATGKVIFDPEMAHTLGRAGQKLILVREETTPDDIHGIAAAEGVVTRRGGMTSHAAVVTRGMGKPCVTGCEALLVDYAAGRLTVNGFVLHKGDTITIDGSTGQVYAAEVPLIDSEIFRVLRHEVRQEDSILYQRYQTFMEWADGFRTLGVRANADTPEDARRARSLGAQGIGLCRTEHMFFAPDRIPLVQRMILAAPEYKAAAAVMDRLRRAKDEGASGNGFEREWKEAAERLKRLEEDYLGALAALEPIQAGDFKAILKEMAGLPVTIRLLDPPLHEFLPPYEELLVDVTRGRVEGADPSVTGRKEALLKKVRAAREVNPMMGLRGCRLGLMYPEINAMQVRAIFNAACDLRKEGVDALPEIMIPLVGHVNEIKLVREQLETVAKQVMATQGVTIPYTFGTMIEVPRGALVAGEIATYAEFFSFGTNDLTQMTYGYSRDDAEGKFLFTYVNDGILEDNPFEVLDTEGVGQLMAWAVERGRKARPGLKVGICGEHGGHPESIAFCHALGLNYVSCSPFRVPVARLAAAHAALPAKSKKGG